MAEKLVVGDLVKLKPLMSYEEKPSPEQALRPNGF